MSFLFPKLCSKVSDYFCSLLFPSERKWKKIKKRIKKMFLEEVVFVFFFVLLIPPFKISRIIVMHTIIGVVFLRKLVFLNICASACKTVIN